jgi:hypothetical protein
MIIFARSSSATTQKWLMDNVQADKGGWWTMRKRIKGADGQRASGQRE